MASSPAHPREIFNNKSILNVKLRLTFSLVLFFTSTFFLFMMILPNIRADVISINAGGSNETAVTPDKYIEGFFFGGICGDGIVDGSLGETCDDGGTVSGDGCSAVCSTEAVTPPGGGGGGGAGGGAAPNIVLNPTQFNINLAVNTTTERTIQVKNLGTNQLTVSVSQANLGSHVILGNTTLTIPAGQTVDLNVVFVALSEPGIFTGTININGKTVVVALNVKTKLLLFDSNIIVLNEDYEVVKGDELKTRVTLIPLGDPERLDVGLFFTIRDYSGNVFLTKSETLLVDRLTNLDRNFDTGSLPLGQYVVGLELRYPNGVAPSSAHFEVIKSRGAGIIGGLILFLISLILIVLIIIILILIWRRRKKKEKEAGEAT